MGRDKQMYGSQAHVPHLIVSIFNLLMFMFTLPNRTLYVHFIFSQMFHAGEGGAQLKKYLRGGTLVEKV